MRNVVYLVATTVDGRIAAADGSFDFFAMEGDHVDEYLATLRTFDDVLMGRGTYEVGTKVGVTDPYPYLKAHVFSTTLTESPHPNVTLVRDNAAQYVRALKAQPGRPIYLCGAAGLAASLLTEGLIDEVVVKLNPVVAGGDAIPMFDALPKPVRLEYVSSKVYGTGVMLITYRVAVR